MCETGPKPAPSYTDLEKRLAASESARREAEKARDDHFAVRLLAETERDRLRERLDQFEAYAITVKSALDDRADRDALCGALQEIAAKCDGQAHGIAARALAASEGEPKSVRERLGRDKTMPGHSGDPELLR